MNQSQIGAEIVEVIQLVPQERTQPQKQTVAGETSQNIVETPTVQEQVIIQETPEVQVVEGIQEQIVMTIEVVPQSEYSSTSSNKLWTSRCRAR